MKTSIRLDLIFLLGFLLTACIKDPETKIFVSDVTLDAKSLTLVEGESTKLIATISPDNATNKNIDWRSSDVNIATVSDGK